MINDLRPAMSTRTLVFLIKNDNSAKIGILNGDTAFKMLKKLKQWANSRFKSRKSQKKF